MMGESKNIKFIMLDELKGGEFHKGFRRPARYSNQVYVVTSNSSTFEPEIKIGMPQEVLRSFLITVDCSLFVTARRD
jgi:hypothetical protein